MIQGQPARPANMANIVAINQGLRPLTAAEPRVQATAPAEAVERASRGAILLDVRNNETFSAGHAAGSLNVQLTHGSFEQWVGWILPPEGDVILVVEKPEEAAAAARKLAFVGLDSRAGSFVTIAAWKDAGLPLESLQQIDVAALEQRIARDGLPVLDVRDDSEWNEGHVASASHRSFKQLGQALDQLPVKSDQEVAVMCAGGLRSVIASSILRRAGYSRIVNVKGGMTAWRRAGLPAVTSQVVGGPGRSS
jgi:hydroxyacylglutathione hydrolase